jgi:hypothetical protein
MLVSNTETFEASQQSWTEEKIHVFSSYAEAGDEVL